MIINKNGDLLKSDCTVIMHQANCFSTMGAGIAKSIAKLYPETQKVDKAYPGKPKDRLGNFSSATVGNLTIVNLYGQFHYGTGKQTNYGKLELAIDSFFSMAKTQNIDLSKVGVPYKIGCGLAGGDWNIVQNILENQSKKHNVNVYIYKL